MKSLIIGMGIGQLYKKVLTELSSNVITADLNQPADYKFYQDAIKYHKFFDTIHICTPNFTHDSIAEQVASKTRFLFVEKPGLKFESSWNKLVLNNPDTRIMMVKNNMYRHNLYIMRNHYKNSNTVKLHWLNHNRVPKPGSWFTTKDLAYGGVSRDLLPHLLSIFAALEPKYNEVEWLYRNSWQRWRLHQLADSDYGDVNSDGTYDVDDNVELETVIDNKRWFIRTSWRTLERNDIAIHFDNDSMELGLCPESAYMTMIQTAYLNEHNPTFWQKQLELDCWIHRNINL